MKYLVYTLYYIRLYNKHYIYIGACRGEAREDVARGRVVLYNPID